MVHYTNCPLCHASNLDDYIPVSDHFLSGEKFMLIKCRECGLVITQDHPDEKDAGRYYESVNYVSHNDKAGGISAAVYRIAREFMLKRKYRMICRAAGMDRGKLLDIGSGTGHFLAMMKKNGWSVTGIEVNEKAREYSKENFGLDVKTGLDNSVIESGPFDVITLWHVLEHFQNPFSYMNEISKLLKKEGILVIALPNSQSSDALYYGEFWAAWDVPRHLWHFTPDVFKRFAQNYGYTVKSMKPLPLDVFYISFLSEKYKGSRTPFLKGLFIGLRFLLTSPSDGKESSSVIYNLSK
jgi:SAM-dependent methyltransferase